MIMKNYPNAAGASNRPFEEMDAITDAGVHIHTYGNSSYYPNTCTSCGTDKK